MAVPLNRHGNEKLLDEPDDLHNLFSGINVVTLKGLPDAEKQSFVDQVFSGLYELDELDRPLYVFLEEAHNFDSGDAADAIQDIVREARKHGIHVVLVSQSPTEFNYSQKHIRENTSTVFMQGEYTGYTDKFSFLDKREITELETGQAIFASRDFPKTYVDIRKPLTRAVKPDNKQIEELDRRYGVQPPNLDQSRSGSSKNRKPGSEQEAVKAEQEKRKKEYETNTEEENLLNFIHDYIQEYDQIPTYSKCYREGPFGTKKTKSILESLIEKEAIEKEEVKRGGQKTEAYKLF